MGNDASKEIKDIADMLEQDGSYSITPNKITRFVPIDPRSPTEGILRTPIEVRRALLSGEMYLLRRKWKSEPDITLGKEGKFAVHCRILRDDPRSPTLGISRTPIQVSYNEERVCAKLYGSTESIYDMYIEQNEVRNVNTVPDCRSPSLGICRTPIQIATTLEDESVKCLPTISSTNISKESNINITPVTQWQTPVSKKSCNSFVYTDVDSVESKGKRDVKQHELNLICDKENDASLKRKLVFTPEPLKTGVKVRTPLGSRCNFQDSPSQLLKIMQSQKVGQELGNGIENGAGNFSLVTKSMRKSHPVVEWDNKDSTIIM